MTVRPRACSTIGDRRWDMPTANACRDTSLIAGALCRAGLAQECGGDFEAWRRACRRKPLPPASARPGWPRSTPPSIDPKVLERDRAQGVFTQTFTEFSGRMISAYRLKQGAANLKKYADVFARAEQEFGVPGPVIAAFWALETDFGAVQGDFNTLNALVTLAHDCRRPELFRPQLVPLLTLIDRGDLPADVKGAWAGEIGQTQILPSDYLLRGVDGDGDGMVDLRGSAPDVIMTTANKIQSRGWKRGQPWMQEVTRARRHALGPDRPHQQAAARAMGATGASPTATARRSPTRACRPAWSCRWATRARPSCLRQLRRLSRMEPVVHLHADRRASRRRALPARRLRPRAIPSRASSATR